MKTKITCLAEQAYEKYKPEIIETALKSYGYDKRESLYNLDDLSLADVVDYMEQLL